MAQFKAMADGVEVNGETVLAIVDGMGRFNRRAAQVLASHGIEDPQPGQWYSQQRWLDAFQFIAEEAGPATLFRIGLKIPEHARFPPEIDSVEKALRSIDVAYHMNHRGGEIGCYRFEPIGENSARMICENPYPCDFDCGIIEGIARKYASGRPSDVFVRHDDSGCCRKQGDDRCVYEVSW